VSIDVTATQIIDGQRYAFMLQVTNFFGEVSVVVEKLVEKSQAPIPR